MKEGRLEEEACRKGDPQPTSTTPAIENLVVHTSWEEEKGGSCAKEGSHSQGPTRNRVGLFGKGEERLTARGERVWVVGRWAGGQGVGKLLTHSSISFCVWWPSSLGPTSGMECIA